MLRGGVGFDPPGCLFTVDAGQRKVHENEVGLLGGRHGNALRSVGRDDDGEPRPREPVFQHVDVVVVVLDVENLHATPVDRRLTHLLISRLS